MARMNLLSRPLLLRASITAHELLAATTGVAAEAAAGGAAQVDDDGERVGGVNQWSLVGDHRSLNRMQFDRLYSPW